VAAVGTGAASPPPSQRLLGIEPFPLLLRFGEGQRKGWLRAGLVPKLQVKEEDMEALEYVMPWTGSDEARDTVSKEEDHKPEQTGIMRPGGTLKK